MAFTLPIVLKPAVRVTVEDLTIEVWVSQRKIPFAMRADAIVVPVAPDLKMVFGVAKMARDYGASICQREADAVAPLEPGDAFVGTGAKYKYRWTGLAVIFDTSKRTSADLITRSIGRAMRLLRERGARSVIFADITENLLSQPNWITPEQRRETARNAARLMLDAVFSGGVPIRSVKIWVWDRSNAEAFIEAVRELQQRRRAAHAANA